MGDVMVICYHAIAPDWDSSLAVTPEEFERHVAGLLRYVLEPALSPT